jgi:hypothetical protein
MSRKLASWIIGVDIYLTYVSLAFLNCLWARSNTHGFISISSHTTKSPTYNVHSAIGRDLAVILNYLGCAPEARVFFILSRPPRARPATHSPEDRLWSRWP